MLYVAERHLSDHVESDAGFAVGASLLWADQVPLPVAYKGVRVALVNNDFTVASHTHLRELVAICDPCHQGVKVRELSSLRMSFQNNLKIFFIAYCFGRTKEGRACGRPLLSTSSSNLLTHRRYRWHDTKLSMWNTRMINRCLKLNKQLERL